MVVFLHSAVTYSGLGGWYYKENDELDMLSMILFAFFYGFDTQCGYASNGTLQYLKPLYV